MGWTSYYVGSPFSAKDRQRELDRRFTWVNRDKDGNETSRVTVLKSSMVGSTYYAAIRVIRKDYDRTLGVVALTSMKDGEFYYKEMEETQGPYECKCPMGILKMLSPLKDDEEWAKAWRDRCYAYHESLKSTVKTKIGDVFECTSNTSLSWGDGYTVSKGEKFFVKYVDYYRHKYFLLAHKDGEMYRFYLKKITKQTFMKLEKKFIGNFS